MRDAHICRELSRAELIEVVGGAGKAPAPQKAQQLFEIDDYSFDIEQVLNIGSATTGAGAGK